MLSLNKYLKASITVLLCLLLFKTIDAQNLISNGSFENITNNDCYGSFDHHTFPNPHILDHWYNFNSPDYFNAMCPNGPLPTQFGYSVPANMFGYSNAKHGNAYIGIEVFYKSGENKEYIYQQLSTSLQAGKIYCMNFYVSRADKIPFAIKNIGAYFSNSLPTLISFNYINAVPQVENQGGIVSDTAQWSQIQGCFTAQGGEQYLTIGNFNTNSNTDTLSIQSANPLTGAGTDISYYYIDDITLYDQSTVEVDEYNNSYQINLFPNPTNDRFTISSQYEIKQIEISSITGKILFSESINQTLYHMQLQDFAEGIYFVKVRYTNGMSVTKKIVKQQ